MARCWEGAMQKKFHAEQQRDGLNLAVRVLELTVKNHPGVLSHICGLFARRDYNLEGIACLPVASGEISRIWLQVNEEEKLEQVIKLLQKLADVRTVVRHDGGHEVFTRLTQAASAVMEGEFRAR